jgi:hypothetical protein
MAANNAVIDDLRDRIAHLEGSSARPKTTLPFGVPEIDERLPGGGLAYGAVHEFAGGCRWCRGRSVRSRDRRPHEGQGRLVLGAT